MKVRHGSPQKHERLSHAQYLPRTVKKQSAEEVKKKTAFGSRSGWNWGLGGSDYARAWQRPHLIVRPQIAIVPPVSELNRDKSISTMSCCKTWCSMKTRKTIFFFHPQRKDKSFSVRKNDKLMYLCLSYVVVTGLYLNNARSLCMMYFPFDEFVHEHLRSSHLHHLSQHLFQPFES